MKARAAVLVGPNRMEMQEFPIPELGPDSLLLRVELTAICGSDRRIFAGTHVTRTFPMIMGHEVVGWVEDLGPGAAETYGVKQGDRVTLEPYIMCKKCRFCLTGYYQLCKSKRCYGVNLGSANPPHLWGGYADYMYVAPNSKVHPIAEGVPAESASLSSVIGNGIRWIRDKGQVRMGESVAICGPGAQGLCAVVAARESGADPIIVLGVSADAPRFELAKALGATHAIDVQKEDAVAAVRALTGGEGAEVVVDCTGNMGSISRSIELARTLGRVVIIGVTDEKPVPIITDHIIRKELTVRGGIGQAWDVEEAVRIINSRRYPIEKIITHSFPLDRAMDAMALFLEPTPEVVRVALVP